MNLRFLVVLFLLVPVLVFAENELIAPYIHKYEANYIYEGNTENRSKGDLVAVLDDGSHWKIHAKDCEQFSKWNVGDPVHIKIQTQTEWYLFKKSHLLLFNRACNESIQVTLLKTPLTIFLSEERQSTSYVETAFRKIYDDYRQNITASDGQEWEIINPASKNSFPKETPIYIGYNEYDTLPDSILCYHLKDEKKYVAFFMIDGAKPDLNWRWTHKGNYRYFFY